MELWLLGAGAVVLIAVTLWIVWPDRLTEPASPAGPARLEESATMQPDQTTRNDLTPMGDRFEDQYTAATGDLSAGGVATTLQQPPATEPAVLPAGAASSGPAAGSGEPWSQPTAARERTSPGAPATAPVTPPVAWDASPAPTAWADTASRSSPVPFAPGALAEPRTIGLGAGALLVAGSAAVGAWLYSRWQRERNKPVNRLRRRARDVAGQISEHLPDVDDLPMGAAPTGGAAAALLLTGVALARALRGGGDSAAAAETAEQARGVDWRAVAMELAQRRGGEAGRRTLAHLAETSERGRKQARELPGRWPSGQAPWRRLRELGEAMPSLRDLGEAVPSRDDLGAAGSRAMQRVPSWERPQPSQPAFMGLGVGGLAVVAGVSYLVWRVLRGTDQPNHPWNTNAGE